MRPTVAGRNAALLVAVALIAGTACSAAQSTPAGTSSTTTPAKIVTTSLPPPTVPSAVPTTIVPAAHVGGAIAIAAIDPEPPVQLTLVKIVDPAPGADQFSVPVADSRFVGVQLKIAFGGSNPVQEDLSGDTAVEDAQGNAYSPTVANLQGCSAFPAGLTLSPGKSAVGCLAFQVPIGARVTEVIFTPGGQFGNVSAAWQVP